MEAICSSLREKGAEYLGFVSRVPALLLNLKGGDPTTKKKCSSFEFNEKEI